eukprot:758797-Hanusia_phi.AAC.2
MKQPENGKRPAFNMDDHPRGSLLKIIPNHSCESCVFKSYPHAITGLTAACHPLYYIVENDTVNLRLYRGLGNYFASFVSNLLGGVESNQCEYALLSRRTAFALKSRFRMFPDAKLKKKEINMLLSPCSGPSGNPSCTKGPDVVAAQINGIPNASPTIVRSNTA